MFLTLRFFYVSMQFLQSVAIILLYMQLGLIYNSLLSNKQIVRYLSEYEIVPENANFCQQTGPTKLFINN